jgi:hypothetical protein
MLLTLLFLGGCASGARMSAMVVPVEEATLISDASPLYQAVRVEVSGGKETNPFWISNVSNEAFQSALENTLELHTLLVKDRPPHFALSAELVSLEQPWIGVDMTVEAAVRYRLTDLLTASVLFDETVRSSYTSSFTESLNANQRIRLASEGAMRSSLEMVIRRLVAAFAPAANPLPAAGQRTLPDVAVPL